MKHNAPMTAVVPLFAAILCLQSVCAAGEDQGNQSAAGPASKESGVSTKDWIPLRRRSAPFRITAGQDEGKEVICTFAPLDLDVEGDHWRMQLGDRRTTWLRRDPDGRLAVVKQVIPDEDAQVVYNPAATLLPARAVGGEVIEEKGEVSIYNMNGEKRTSGTYSQEIEYVGRVKVRTPADQYAGRRLRVLQKMDTDWADIRVAMDMVLAPGVGRVYQHTGKKVEKLGFFEDTSIEEIKRAEP